MPMIIGVALFTLVLLIPRVMKLWPLAASGRERLFLAAMAAGPFVLGLAVFAIVWGLNPLNVQTGAMTVGELAGLVVGSVASIAAILVSARWKTDGEASGD